MEKTLRKATIRLSTEAAFILITIVSAVILPQIFHAAGVLLGVGGQLGQMFLPMYIPVIIFGFYRGAVPGAIAGILAPLCSYAITQMPAKALLPYIAIELVFTGFFAGIFSKVKMPSVLRVLSVQICAKIVRIASLAVVLYAANGTVSTSSLFAGIITSVPGVILQLVLVSLLIYVKEKKNA